MTLQIKTQINWAGDIKFFFRYLNLVTGEMTEDYFYMKSEEKFIEYLNECNREYIRNKQNYIIWPLYEDLKNPKNSK